MEALKFIVAYKSFTGWIEFVKCDDVNVAQHALELCAQDNELSAIFYNRTCWESYNPRYVIDNRDHSNTTICNCWWIINSASSTAL